MLQLGVREFQEWAIIYSMIVPLCIFLIIRIATPTKKTNSIPSRGKLQAFLLRYFDKDEVDYALRFYIPVHFDLLIPSRKKSSNGKENLDRSIHKTLISYLVSEGLNKKNPFRYFLVLADAGVGKTTFILNLYSACIQHSQYKDNIYVLPLRHAETLNTIKEIENPAQSILLLDGLNEDALAIQNYEKRLREIMEATKYYKKVVITCRGYFFSSEHELPFRSFLAKNQEEWEAEKLCCFSLTHFDLDQIQRYIKKKYSLWDYKKRRSALHMVEQTPHLMRQPLLLSYAETLLEAKKGYYKYSYQIYEDLIFTWIERAGSVKEVSEQETFRDQVFQLMKNMALRLYQKHKLGEVPFLEESETIGLVYQHRLHPQDLYADSRSVISFHPDLGYRFSHSSIMEYFIAREAYENLAFLKDLSFAGVDQALKFLQEMIIDRNYSEVKGQVSSAIGANSSLSPNLKPFHLCIYPVTVQQYRIFCEVTDTAMPEAPNWGWEEEAPIVGVPWQKAMDYCLWLSKLTGLNFSLPHEKEWEYAAMGGHKSRKFPFSGHKNIAKVAWYAKNSQRQTHPVGMKQPNILGLYDMSGHTWEWCSNWFEYQDEISEKAAPANTRGKAMRGGSWLHHEDACKIITRGWSKQNTNSSTIGFRLKLTVNF